MKARESPDLDRFQSDKLGKRETVAEGTEFQRQRDERKYGSHVGSALIDERKTNMEQEERTKKIHKIIAKAWSDEGFKRRLLSAPGPTLKDEGVDVVPGVEVRVVADTDKVKYLVVPTQPSSDEMSEEDLVSVAGGYERCSTGTPPTPRLDDPLKP
jgi:hypothetical protein